MKRLNKYDKYKDSEIEWIGKIPEHWDLTKLKYVTKCLDGRRIPLSAEERGEKQGDIPYWGANGIIDYVNDYLIDEEVVLLGEDGAPFFDKSKDVAFYSNGKIWPNNHIHILQPTKIYIKLLVYLLNAVDYTDYINGSTRDKLTQSDMGNINLLSIPFDEQQAIVNFLDQKTSEIDSLIADKERLIELLQEQRQAIITQAVTKGLDPNVPMKDSGIEWIGEIPEHWEVLKLKYVVTLKSGKNITSDLITDDGEYPVYGGNGLRGYTSNFTHSGDYVLIGRQGALCGNISYAKGRFWASEHAVVVESLHHMEIFWIGELLRSMNLNQYSISAAQPGLAVERIKNLYIPVPPYDEQKLITDTIKPNVSRINNIIVLIKEQISKLKEYRQSLITAAVTGKIDVRNYNIESDQVEGEEQEEVS